MIEDQINELRPDAILSSVLEICAPRLKDFKGGLSYVQPSIVNFLGMVGGAVPFGRVTEEDEKMKYEDYRNDSYTEGMKAAIKGSTGLPLSVQIASYPGRECLVLALMKQIEEETREMNDYPSLI